MHHPTDRIAHTTAFVTPVVEHWLKRETETNLESTGAYEAASTAISLQGVMYMRKW